MKKIIIGFSYSKYPLSKVIRFFLDSDISHSYVKISVPEYDEEMIFHATWPNVQYTNYGIFKEVSTPVYEYEMELTDEEYEKSEHFRIRNCGKPYSFKLLLGFILIILLKSVGFYIDNPFSDNDSTFICSEYTAKCMVKDLGIKPENIDPKMLKVWCDLNLKRIR